MPRVSQLTPYSPVHSFVSDSATVPNFPGQALDVEFNAVKATTDQIRANIALIQRDDGAIANNSITYDQLSVALQTAGLQPATLWIVATTYQAGANVIQSANLYRALVAHTSGVFATDLAAGKWVLVGNLVAGPTGAAGPANTLAIGTVTTGSVAATITGVAPNQTLNLVIPPGAQGNTGLTGAGYGGSSTTSLLIANTVTKVFTTQAGLAYQLGNYVRASSAANGANYMEGYVSAYAGTSMSIDVKAIGGAGTFADWNFASAGVPGTVGVSTLNGQAGAKIILVMPQGRLTLTSLTPALATSVAAATNLYYTPAKGAQVPIYDGTNFDARIFSELTAVTTDATKSPAAIGASKVNNWFVWDDAGTLRLSHGPDWTTDVARSAGTALVLVNGINLNNASITNGPAASRGTYVGTTRSNSGSTLDFIFGALASGGTAANFAVWNAYNRVPVATCVGDTTASWTHVVANTWRAPNGSATMRVSCVRGLNEDGIEATYAAIGQNNASSTGAIGIGLNSTTALAVPSTTGFYNATIALNQQTNGRYSGLMGLGYNFVSAIEFNTTTNANTWLGGAGVAYLQSGLHCTLRA
jgi:hypothetical protein